MGQAMSNNGSKKIAIPKGLIYTNTALFDVFYFDGEYCATLKWMATDKDTGDYILQPSVYVLNAGKRFLSFDGQANFIGGHNDIIHPSDGGLYEISPLTNYYFNETNPEVPEPAYALQYNNKSIRLNNISIFSEDFSQGVVMDFRASFEGTLSDGTKTAYINVLSTIDAFS